MNCLPQIRYATMSSKYRFLWNSFLKVKSSFRTNLAVSKRGYFKKPPVPYCVFGFSVFTWLGFEKPLTAEDELINTIKHCVLFIQKEEFVKAEQLLHVALRQAQQMHHEDGITYIYDLMANLALEREEVLKAKPLFVSVSQRIMAKGATEDDLRIVHISVKLARISHLLKEYSTAQLGYDWCLTKLRKAFENEPTEDIKKLLALAEDWYGRLFIDCNKYEQGLKYMTESLDKMRQVSDLSPEQLVTQLNDIGTVHDSLGNVDDSINYFKEAIELAKPLPDMPSLGIIYVNLGRAYIKKQMIYEARKNCGFGWRLGVTEKNNDVKKEAEICLKDVNNIANINKLTN